MKRLIIGRLIRRLVVSCNGWLMYTLIVNCFLEINLAAFEGKPLLGHGEGWLYVSPLRRPMV